MTLLEQKKWVKNWCKENKIKLGHYDFYSARAVYDKDKVWIEYSDDSCSYSIFAPDNQPSVIEVTWEDKEKVISILYQIFFDIYTNTFTSCNPVGVITAQDCDIKCCKRVLDDFIVYVQSNNGVEDAKIKAMKLMESWV